ncbi:MAG: hypothetical protein KJ044_10865, partial [Planctomycetes bacterium]|nr:hypothetical protein [Planctomycetota bacterium]
MSRFLGVAVVAAATAMLVGLTVPPTTSDVPAAAVPAPAATVPPDAGDNALAPLATRILLDAGGAGSGPELIQARGPLPAGWKPDPPLDLSGPMPSDADVRAAITKGVNYILGLQKENGAWDVDLTGTLLSET